jgi:hypothetical protein
MKYILSWLFLNFLSITLFSQSLYLSQDSQYVSLGDLDIIGNKITLEAKVAVTYEFSNDVISKHTHEYDISYLLRPKSFEIRCADKFHLLKNPIQLNMNQLYHIAGTYDGITIKYYLDGCLVASEEAEGDLHLNNLNTRIGNNSSLYQYEQYIGYIQEARIWNVARSEEEIKTFMNDLPQSQFQNGLVAYYKFEGTNPFENLQGNSRWNGTPVGNPEIKSNPFDKGPIIPFSIDKIDIIDVSGYGGADGKVIIHAKNGTKNYQYSLDGINFQSDSIFNNLKAGTYRIFIKDAGCLIEQDISVKQPSCIFSIKFPRLIGLVGTENYSIPLIVSVNFNIYQSLNLSFTAKIKFNAATFLPTGITRGQIVDNVIGQDFFRILTIQCDNTSISNNDSILTEIIGTVLLGETLTDFEIMDFQISSQDCLIDTIVNGSLEIKACALPIRRIKLFTTPDFSIQPNPSSDNISISFTNGINQSIHIYNSLGIEIKRFEEKDLFEKNSIDVNMEEFPSGIYYVKQDIRSLQNFGCLTKSFVVIR